MSVRDRDGEVAERVRRGQGASESADVEPSVGRSGHESSPASGAAGTTAGVGRERATAVSAACDGEIASTVCTGARERAGARTSSPTTGAAGTTAGVGRERATAVSAACDGESVSTACMDERERARVRPLSPASDAVDVVRASVASTPPPGLTDRP
jgi:hypothetical protein